MVGNQHPVPVFLKPQHRGLLVKLYSVGLFVRLVPGGVAAAPDFEACAVYVLTGIRQCVAAVNINPAPDVVDPVFHGRVGVNRNNRYVLAVRNEPERVIFGEPVFVRDRDGVGHPGLKTLVLIGGTANAFTFKGQLKL